MWMIHYLSRRKVQNQLFLQPANQFLYSAYTNRTEQQLHPTPPPPPGILRVLKRPGTTGLKHNIMTCSRSTIILTIQETNQSMLCLNAIPHQAAHRNLDLIQVLLGCSLTDTLWINELLHKLVQHLPSCSLNFSAKSKWQKICHVILLRDNSFLYIFPKIII
jgi:hypothetical protein